MEQKGRLGGDAPKKKKITEHRIRGPNTVTYWMWNFLKPLRECICSSENGNNNAACHIFVKFKCNACKYIYHVKCLVYPLDAQQTLVGWKSSLEQWNTNSIHLSRTQPSKKEKKIY